VVGVFVYSVGCHLAKSLAWPVVPPPVAHALVAWRAPELLPKFACSLLWWQHVGFEALAYLPIMLPFALATIVGGIDCAESAAAAGDEYDTRSILLTEGLASVAAGACGGVIQNCPYIGHPAYKAMGGRAAYTLATAIFIGAAGLFGWFTHIFEWLPEAAAFPILVFVGLEIATQSFHATPERHFPALVLAIFPALAYSALIPLDMALAGGPPAAHAAVVVQSLRCLAGGFIVTSLLWASALAELLDGKLVRSASYLALAGLCSLFGIIHSPLQPAVIALPSQVVARMSRDPAILCQSPYHWAAAYGLAAVLLIVLSFFRDRSQLPGDRQRNLTADCHH
jgi:AGZA family xanthine/uracil permease-like MFS transporter